ncbi:dolichyl pyrophosphate phosphatase [Novymonas esmeraldas]|uniref:Dolichyl pyrophosphate phosphatase n=1 Tax=Novymonas esmeraldas TaxID=1808958 RepID=A0AAW0F470_9TRYP
MSWADVLGHAWGYTHLSAAERLQGEAVAHTRQQRAAAAGVGEAPSSQWATWAMTEVVYRRQDVLSKLFGISSIGPVAMMVLLAGLTIAPCRERRIPAMRLIAFLVLSVCVNVAIKAAVRSRRPAHPAAGMNYTTVHGMPSDHAQFMAGFSVYLLRSCARARRGCGEAAKHGRVGGPRQVLPLASTVSRRALVALLLCGTLFIGAGRVYNGYHTVGQVLVGWAVGVMLALACTTSAAQRGLTWVAERILVPVMLVCTFWAEAIC